MPKPTRLLLVAALSMAALTACSGAPAGEQSPPVWDSIRGRDLQEPGPLEAYLGVNDPSSTRDFVAYHTAREEATAACMAELGFEYTPSVIRQGTLTVSEGPQRGTRAFAETYGYGVWDQPETEPGQATAEIDGSANAAYVASLSPEARQAYEIALHGQPTAVGDGILYDGSGCSGSGASRSDNPQEVFQAGVREEANAFLESIREGTDPRIMEVEAAWASCMRDAGYDDASPSAAEARVVEEISAYFAEHTTGVDAELIAEKADEERRFALADMDCREETDWAQRRRAIELELQQEYVDSHRADLEALLEASGTS